MIVKAVCGQLFLPWFSGYLKTGALWEQGFLQGTWRRALGNRRCGLRAAYVVPWGRHRLPLVLCPHRGLCAAHVVPCGRHRLPLVLCPRRGGATDSLLSCVHAVGSALLMWCRGLYTAYVVPWRRHRLPLSCVHSQQPSHGKSPSLLFHGQLPHQQPGIHSFCTP